MPFWPIRTALVWPSNPGTCQAVHMIIVRKKRIERKSRNEKRVASHLLFRIYTEDKPERRDAIIGALRKCGVGFTIIAGGVGQAPNATPEPSAIIDVVTENNDEQIQKIKDLAEEIRQKNDDQDAVLMACAEVSAKLVEKIKTAEKDEDLRRQTMVLDKEWTVELEPTRRPVSFLKGRIVLSIGNWHNLLGPADRVHGVRPGEKRAGKFLKFEVTVPERRSASRQTVAPPIGNLQNRPTET